FAFHPSRPYVCALAVVPSPLLSFLFLDCMAARVRAFSACEWRGGKEHTGGGHGLTILRRDRKPLGGDDRSPFSAVLGARYTGCAFGIFFFISPSSHKSPKPSLLLVYVVTVVTRMYARNRDKH
ncbi:hypothetical protein MAPG_11991, partial [Magnaporthiopsis poae ATCC 64411]|uniref:Secreted protein n=1 Tax=Magnaporthiopsis poae (strain ATCC 64411 / 73-15) TaxID=644358 RepID=A0A0C4EGM1_MAGP6